MTKLEKLIKELCPDGVEYKQLSEITYIARGTRVVKKQLFEEGKYPVFQNCLTPMGYYDKCNVKANTTFIICAGTAGEIGFSNVDFWAADDCFYFVCDGNLINRFLYHFLLANQNYLYSKVRKASIPRLSRSFIETIRIPILPLVVQSEIVRILDNYSVNVATLQQELKKELKIRSNQYLYYQNKLFSTATDIKLVTIDKISHNCDNQRKPVTSTNREAGDIPYYGASGIVDYVKDYIFDGDYLLVSEDGANLLARSTPIAFSITGKTWVNNHAHILKFDNLYTRKYVEYYLNSIDLSRYITGGTQPKLNQKNLNKIEIPLPSIEEQERIVKILDRFDKYYNDIKEELLAEIKERQKQYEYYRDKLLSFREIKS